MAYFKTLSVSTDGIVFNVLYKLWDIFHHIHFLSAYFQRKGQTVCINVDTGLYRDLILRRDIFGFGFRKLVVFIDKRVDHRGAEALFAAHDIAGAE